MLRNFSKNDWIILSLALLSFLLSALAYPYMPPRIATHWNAYGQVDGYMSPFWGLFLLPLINASMALLFLAIPHIDPRKSNIALFRKQYDRLVILVLVFMLVVQLQVILWNLGVQISPNLLIPVGIGLLYFYIGIVFEHAKPNWFVGIRTPWTLSSDIVWEKTHRLGARLFKLAGIITIASVLVQDYAVWILLVTVLVIALVLVIYSYVEYKKLPESS